MIEALFDVMQTTGADFTNTFRFLSRVRSTQNAEAKEGAAETDEALELLLAQTCSPDTLHKAYKPKIPPHYLRTLPLFAAHSDKGSCLFRNDGGDAQGQSHDFIAGSLPFFFTLTCVLMKN